MAGGDSSLPWYRNEFGWELSRLRSVGWCYWATYCCLVSIDFDYLSWVTYFLDMSGCTTQVIIFINYTSALQPSFGGNPSRL